jgi:predicted kinase
MPSSDPSLYVVVSGLPGSGKTSLATAVARELGLPLLSKDTIKETLFDVLGTGDVDWSKRLGLASTHVLLELARASAGAVLESFWDPPVARDELRSLDGHVVELFCDCPAEVARDRYRRRVGEGRHPGHLDTERDLDFDEWVRSGRGEPVGTGGPLLRVRTTEPVDIATVVDWVRRHSNPATS